MALLLAASFFLLYLPFMRGHFSGTDEVGVFEATQALYQKGNLVVPAGVHVFRGREGKAYNHFAIGQSVLALPLYAAGQFAERNLPPSWVRMLAGPAVEAGPVRWGGTLEIFMVCLYPPIATGVLLGVFFLFERRLGVSLRNALLATVLLGATTYVAMMSGYFLCHTTEAATILGGLYGFYVWKGSGRLAALAAGSLVASLTLLIRVPAAFAGPGLAGYLLLVLMRRAPAEGPRRMFLVVLPAVLLPFLAVMAVHLGQNYVKWGTWLSSPMLAQHSLLTGSLYVGLLGFLLSPACSIFAYSPLLCLVPWTLRTFWRDHRLECAAVVGISLIFLLVCSKFRLWTGLWSSPGPRYLFLVTPLLMLALGPWLDGPRRAREWAAVGGLALVGAVVQFVLMAASWIEIVRIMEYPYDEFGFVFVPSQSPIVGALRAVRQNLFDSWLWRIWHGWKGQPGAPHAVVIVLLAWAFLLGICAALLWRSVRRPAVGGGQPGLPLMSP